MMDTRIYDGWEERCRTVALFQTICDLGSGTAAGFGALNLRAVALSVLVFVLGVMLDARHCTERDVEEHLRAVLGSGQAGAGVTEIDPAALRAYLLERLQNRGRVFVDEFSDLRPGESERLSFRFTLLDNYFAGGNDRTIYLRLSPDGLDLLFKTRELHKELGISIAQLLFRQQITRGIFDGALGTLRDLRLEVERRKDGFRQLDRQIYRAVESVTAGMVRQAWQETVALTGQEQATFHELRMLVADTRDRLETPVRSDREAPAVHKLWQIDQELARVITDHSEIVKMAAETARNHRESVARAIGRAVTVKVDLELEVLDQVAAGGAAPQALLPWLAPLFRPQSPRLFNPMRAFEPQYLTQAEHESGGEELIAADAALAAAAAERERRQIRAELDQYRLYLGVLLSPLAAQPVISLTGALAQAPPSVRAAALADDRFGYLLLYLHREPAVRYANWRQLDAAALVDLAPPLAALCELIAEAPAWTLAGAGFRFVAPADPQDLLIRADGTLLTNLRIERVGEGE